PWRPQLLVPGGVGYGKSTIARRITDHLGGNGRGCLLTDDISEAALRIWVNAQTLAILYDEANRDRQRSDKDADKRRLFRSLASDTVTHRGTSDHRSVSFSTRASVALFGTDPLPSDEADESRFVTVELGPLPRKLLVAVTPEECHGRAEKLLRLALDGREL